MTAKSCLNCSQLGSYNIGKTGRRCYGIAAIPAHYPVVIKLSALAGFYCGNWSQAEVVVVKNINSSHPIQEPPSPRSEAANTLHKCYQCDATEMLTVIAPQTYACPTHYTSSPVALVDRVINVMEKKNPTSH